jgi:inorganic triphosphatase YgiF
MPAPERGGATDSATVKAPPGTAAAAEPAATRVADTRPAAEEIELKLVIDAEQARKLGRLPLIRGSLAGRTVSRKMHSVYYDTPEQDLRRAGAGLRLRREGSRWVQTLKSGGSVEAGLHRRSEIESRVPAQLLDYRALAESGVTEVLADPARRARLQPVFTADFTRTLRVVEPTPGTRIELALDVGSITAGERSVPVSELELELKAGAAEALLDFAATLVQQVPGLQLEPCSKAQRGYALAAGKVDAPVKASAPPLDRSMPPAAALRAIVFACVEQLQANEAGVAAGADIEYLHQARVAMRRLRSALSVFRPGFPRAAFEDVVAELRWLDGSLGPARDWDVFSTATLPRIVRAFAQQDAMAALVEHAQRLRAAAQARAAQALRAPRYTVLLLRLVGAFHRHPWLAFPDQEAAGARSLPLAQFAASVLARRHRKVTRTGRRLVKGDPRHESDHAELHRLRIEIKKLRYAAEFFAQLYARKSKGYAAALAGLQALLGGLNDAATVERLCTELRHDGAGGLDAEALGLVRGWAAAGAQAHLAQFPDAWKQFREATPFWEE